MQIRSFWGDGVGVVAGDGLDGDANGRPKKEEWRMFASWKAFGRVAGGGLLRAFVVHCASCADFDVPF